MFAYATAIAVSMCRYTAKDGVTARTRPAASIANWACNCVTNHQSVGSRPSCAMTRRPATRVNEIWAMDFVHDQLATGGKLRVRIIDIFSRFSPALEPRLTFRGTDVVDVLERLCNEVGFPATIRVDQGSEFVSRDFDLWAYQRGVTLDFSRPGKPTDNAFIEAFNGRFRAECLNAHWFLSLLLRSRRLRR
ncbi:transposase InsO family protein [Bradyrhizobium niftali]